MASLQSTSVTGSLSATTTVSDETSRSLRTVPVNSVSSVTLAASDTGELVSATSTVTVPSGVFSAGQLVSIYNNTSGGITVAQGGGVTLRLAGTSNTGNRTLAQRGLCTVVCVGSNDFVISGSGLS